jgi:hypothetical protein
MQSEGESVLFVAIRLLSPCCSEHVPRVRQRKLRYSGLQHTVPSTSGSGSDILTRDPIFSLSRLRAFLGLFFESIDDRLGEGLGPAVPGSAESSPSPSRWMGGSVNIVAALGSRGAVSHRPLSPVATTLLAPSQSYRARTEWRESVHVTKRRNPFLRNDYHRTKKAIT